MVHAIISGQKNQTRRTRGLDLFNELPADYYVKKFYHKEPAEWEAYLGCGLSTLPEQINPRVKCPYGKVGDWLWVRECFKYSYALGEYMIQFRAGLNVLHGDEISKKISIKYARHLEKGYPSESFFRWRPSIHMDRWASRFLLDVTDIRIERLQDITQTEAIGEGVEKSSCSASCPRYKDYMSSNLRYSFSTPAGSFMSLWDSINGKDSWKENPWVWVVAFNFFQ